MTAEYRAGLFDLDGVIVDTARYHFLAWRALARELGADLTEAQNQRLKGVSRSGSLEIVLEIAGLSLSAAEKAALAEKKNADYLAHMNRLDRSALLPGAENCLGELRAADIRTALGSTSRNAVQILRALGIESLFDAVIDGNKVQNTKPDPEVFLLGARALGVAPAGCIVFEDAEVGLQAARSAGMLAAGIGRAADLPSADIVFESLAAVEVPALFGLRRPGRKQDSGHAVEREK